MKTNTLRNGYGKTSTVLLGVAIVTALAVATPAQCADFNTSRSASARRSDQVVYLYNSDGQPILQPGAYVQGGGVYTDADVFIGTLDPSTNNIISGGVVIGYVGSQPV